MNPFLREIILNAGALTSQEWPVTPIPEPAQRRESDSLQADGSAADGRSEIETLKARIEAWALSLPEAPQWDWLREEMLTVARTQPPNVAVSDKAAPGDAP